MILKRYIVEVDPAQALKLSDDQVALATQISTGPTKLLIFRDRFVAYKVATRSGGIFRQGHVVDGEALKGGFSVEGRTLMLEGTTNEQLGLEA